MIFYLAVMAIVGLTVAIIVLVAFPALGNYALMVGLAISLAISIADRLLTSKVKS